MDGEPRITADPPLIVPVADLLPDDQAEIFSDWVHARLREYRRTLETDRRRLLERYRFVDLARKVVGVGSVGTRAWIALMLGRDARDPLFLQIKEAQPSVLEEFAGRSEYRNAGHRVVSGQRLMQAASDVFLGWIRVTDAWTAASATSTCASCATGRARPTSRRWCPRACSIYAQMCGWTLARAHARSGDRVAIAAYLGTSDAFDRAIAAFSVAYADQNERDYALLKDAVASGRLTAETGRLVAPDARAYRPHGATSRGSARAAKGRGVRAVLLIAAGWDRHRLNAQLTAISMITWPAASSRSAAFREVPVDLAATEGVEQPVDRIP